MDHARALSDRTVAHRRVFYIPGYDPMPPRRYRELYRREGAAQAALSGYTLEPAPKAGGQFGWGVRAQIEDVDVEAQIEVLVWSDIVRDSMGAGIAATYSQLIRTAWVYISSGALRRLMWLRKGPVIAALYPVGMLLLQLILALVAGGLAAWLFSAGLSAVGLPGALGWIMLPVVTVLCLRWFRRQDGRFFAYYLMHDYAFSARWQGANPTALEERMDHMGQTIAEALYSDTDEVLIVGHSSGAHLAVSILADLLRAGRVPANGPVLSFLSLGQVVPMMSFLPGAHRLRADLAFLSATERLTWVDVTAPGDGCAFALCDPVAVSGVAPDGAHQPLILSAAFTQTLAPQTWRALRWRFFRLHFQYLCAFDNLPDRVDAYDYFRVTAGPRTLADRFANRSPSKSRIDVPASRYTSTVA